MRNRTLDRFWPSKAQVASARLDRQNRHWHGIDIGAVAVQLSFTESVREPISDGNDLCAQYIVIKTIGALPVRDVNDAMIKMYGVHQRASFQV